MDIGIRELYFSKNIKIEEVAEKVEAIFLSYLIKEMKILNIEKTTFIPTMVQTFQPIIETQMAETLAKNFNLGIKELIIKDLAKLYR